MKSSASVRDVSWATLTCPLGWCVQGIWREGSDGRNIAACMAIADISDIVVCDEEKLLLYRYPSVSNGSLHQIYSGHSSKISCARFSFSKKYVISIGSNDRSILLWRHDCELVDDSDDLADSSGSSSSSAQSDAEGNFKKSMPVGASTASTATVKATSESIKTVISTASSSAIALFKSVSPSSNVVRPWKSAFVEPSWMTAKVGSTDVDVELEWIHGYRHDGRSNLLFAASGTIVYNVAALAVVYNKATAKQQFLHGAHENEVISIAPHPTGVYFATGDKHPNPTIFVWSSKDMQVLNKISNAHSNGVSLLSFNTKGNYLASLGMDGNNTLCLHDWMKGVEIFRTPTDENRVLCMAFLCGSDLAKSVQNNTVAEPDIICTGGFKHLKFWWAYGPNVKSQRGLWGKKKKSTVSCIASASPKICVSGSTDGSLLVWKDFKLFSDAKEEYRELGKDDNIYLHADFAIQSIWAIKGNVTTVSEEFFKHFNEYPNDFESSARYVVGDSGGNIGIWRMVKYTSETHPLKNDVDTGKASASTGENRYSLVLVKYFHLRSLSPTAIGSVVQSVCERDGVILVGTNASEIYEVNESSFTPFSGSLNSKETSKPSTKVSVPRRPKVDSKCHNNGHSGGEVWGLAMHPKELVFMTTGDDALLKVWSLVSNRMLSYIKLPDKARAIAINSLPQFCVVLNSGKVLVFELDSFLIKEGRELNNNKSGLNLSALDVIATNTFDEIKKLTPKVVPKSPSTWAQVAKYSFLGTHLAIGSHDTKIYLYDVAKDYELIIALNGHSTFITHLDFGVLLKKKEVKDEKNGLVTYMERYEKESGMIMTVPLRQEVVSSASKQLTKAVLIEESIDEENVVVRKIDPKQDVCIQSADSSGNLLFWRITGNEKESRIESAIIVKDVWWATFTCPYGWSVQGIWPLNDQMEGANSLDYTAVARSNSYEKVPVLAAADNWGKVFLFISVILIRFCNVSLFLEC